MKCLIYARQSSSTNEEYSESVENQVFKCEELARKEGYEVCGVYRDLNISGKTYPTGSEQIATIDIAFQTWYKEQTTRKMYREGLGKLIEQLSTENIDMIMVYDVTRLYRPISGSFLESHINQILIMHGLKIMTVNQGIIDLGNFNDSLITALQNRINHEQIAIQRRKAKEALRNLKDTGVYQSGIEKKWGFKAGIGKKEILIDECESSMVKTAFELVNNGYSMNNTCKELNVRFKPILPQAGIGRVALRKMLKSPIYCGYIYNSQGELVKSQQTDGFIDFSLWKSVNDILMNRKGKYRRDKKNWHPLTGYVYCGVCKSKMTAHHSSSPKIQHYICQSHIRHYDMTPCHNNMTISNTVKYGEGLIEAVYPLLTLAALKELEITQNDNKIKDELNKLKIDYSNIIEREKKLTNMYINGLIDEESLENTLQTISEKKKSLHISILNQENMLKSSDNSVDNQIALLKAIVDNNITKEEYEKLVQKTIKAIYITKDNVTIETFYGTVIIPRQHLANFKLLPHYFMNMDNEYNINLIYYYGLEQLIPDVGWKTNLIADFGKLKIWYKKAGAN